jgi:hypothetical protein
VSKERKTDSTSRARSEAQLLALMAQLSRSVLALAIRSASQAANDDKGAA